MYCAVESNPTTIIFFTWDRAIPFSAIADRYYGAGFGNT
jgi:hypothetical protein